MTLNRALGIIIGVAAFGIAHGLITGAWLRATLTPDPLIRPWFTNSSGSVLLTAALVAFAAFSMALGAGDRRGAMARGVIVGVGAIVAMLGLMIRLGAGTLGPIAFIVGAVVLLAAGTAGASLAAVLKRA